MKKIVYLFAFLISNSFAQENRMSYFTNVETGTINNFQLNDVLTANNLLTVKQNVFGANVGYIFCPKKVGYFSSISYLRTSGGSIYQSLCFSIGPVFNQKLFKSNFIKFVPFISLRSHNVNVKTINNSQISANQLENAPGGDLYFLNGSIDFGGKLIMSLNSRWNFGISFESASKSIIWELKNQHISNLPADSYRNFTASIGYNFKLK